MEEINEKLHMDLLDFDKSRREEWVKNRKPFSVLFELTSNCNMNCIHCYLQNSHSHHQLTYQQIINIIDILYDKGIIFLTFTGGEILTRSDFIDIYFYAKKRGFLVELFTNGYLFTDEIISVLKEYPPLLVDISIYGANEETYYKITGIRGAYERVVQNCVKLKNAGIRVALKSPILNTTLHELTDMKNLAESMGIPFVYTFEICSTIDKCDSPKELQVPLQTILAHEFENYYDQINSNERIENQDNSLITDELKKNPHVFTCNVALNSFVIDYEGRMLPCMKLRHKGKSLLENDFDKLWEEYKKYSQLIASETYVCKGCDAAYYCDVCPAEMDFLYGNMEYRPEGICQCAIIRKKFYEGEISFKEAIKMASIE